MLSLTQAQQIIISHARSFGKETVGLDYCYRRILAETIEADRDYPPFNRAAMDGFAIRHDDWKGGVSEFQVVETIYAGNFSNVALKKGECYKIMTGAAVPIFADTIIRKEDTTEENHRIHFTVKDVKPFQHISKKGEDIKEATIIIGKAIRFNTSLIGLLASLGKSKVIVERLPKVGIITTGDEVVTIDSLVNEVQIRNSNVFILQSLLKLWDITPDYCDHVLDNIDQLESIITKNLVNDIVIINGGVSAGDADYVPQVLEKLGAKMIFHKVAIKPGKPIWFGKFQNGPVIFALPGNPFSCFITFKLFIEVFLCASFGIDLPTALSLPLYGTRVKISTLDEFFPVKISGNPSGLELIQFNGSGDITAAISADGIAQHLNQTKELLFGTIIPFYSF